MPISETAIAVDLRGRITQRADRLPRRPPGAGSSAKDGFRAHVAAPQPDRRRDEQIVAAQAVTQPYRTRCRVRLETSPPAATITASAEHAGRSRHRHARWLAGEIGLRQTRRSPAGRWPRPLTFQTDWPTDAPARAPPAPARPGTGSRPGRSAQLARTKWLLPLKPESPRRRMNPFPV